MYRFVIRLFVILFLSGSAAAAFQPGERVQVRPYLVTWEAATVVEAGSGARAGSYSVRRDSDAKTPIWVAADAIRQQTAEEAKQAAEAEAARSRVYQVGDRVMAYYYGWYKGTVVEVGSGISAGDFRVRRDDYPKIPEWYSPSNLKPMAEQKRVDDRVAGMLAAGPRAGRYRAWGYGAPGAVPLFYGDFELSAGGRYKYWRYGKEYAGEGRWRYDPAAQAVVWLSGPFQGDWQGGFSVRGDGKIHSIRLKPQVEASNSL